VKSIEETDNWVEGVDFKFGKHGPEALKKGMTARPDFHSKRGFSIVPIEQAMRDTAKYLFDVNMAQLEEALDFAVKQASPEDARSALNEIKVRSLKDVARGFCLILTYGG